MAYQAPFNPDALPAHVEPEQAAQQLSNLQANRKPSPHPPKPYSSPLNPNANRTSPPPGRRISPAALAARESYRPVSIQQHPQYHYQPPTNPTRIHSDPPPTFDTYSHATPPPPTQNSYQTYSNRPDLNGPRRTSNPISPPLLPSRTPNPPSPDSADLYHIFLAANTSNTSALTHSELSSALVNADYSPFDPHTITTMMRLFSTSPGQNTITYPEFQNLWRFLAAWRDLFERFDEDRSSRISLTEFSKALVSFGYRLSQPFIGVLYHAYADRQSAADRRGSGGASSIPQRVPVGGNHYGSQPQKQPEGMGFDLFVQACISLKRMTDVFKGYDDDRDGYVTLSFEEFLTEILRLRE